MKKILSLIISCSVLLQSCSTILQGSKQDITIQSVTPGAKILVNGDELGRDQVTTRLRRNKNHTILVKKDGFETKSITLEKQVQAGYIVVDGLLAFTGLGLAWIIVDAATGSWHKFDKDKYVVELEKSKN